MKQFVVILSLVCLVTTATRAQSGEQHTPTPLASGWQIVTQVPNVTVGRLSTTGTDTVWYSGGNAASSVLLRSINQGQDWMPMNVPDKAGFCNFISGTMGFDVVDSFSNSTVYPVVLKTTNAGLTWATHSSETNGQMNTIGFMDRDTAFILGGGKIIRTSDGGESWHEIIIDAANLRDISFSSSKIGYMVGDMIKDADFPTRDAAGGCFKTEDGGRTWKQIYVGVNSNLWAVKALNDTTVVIAGIAGWICRTTNGGGKWVNTPVASKEGILSLDFSSNSRGILVGGAGAIYITTDGGMSWTKQQCPISEDLESIKLLNDSVGLIASDVGYILRTSNGGISAVSVPTTTPVIHVSVYPNPSTNSVQFQYTLSSPIKLTFNVYTEGGQFIASLLQEVVQPSGLNTLILSTNMLSTGTYFYRLGSDSVLSSGSFTIIK